MVSNSTNISNVSFGTLSQFGFTSKFSRVIVVALAALAALALVYFAFNRESFHQLTRNFFKKSTPQTTTIGSTPSQESRTTQISEQAQQRISKVVSDLFFKAGDNGATVIDVLRTKLMNIQSILQRCPEGDAYNGQRHSYIMSNLAGNLDKCLFHEVNIQTLIDTVQSLQDLRNLVMHSSNYALRLEKNKDQRISLQLSQSSPAEVKTYQEWYDSYIKDFLDQIDDQIQSLETALGLPTEWYRLWDDEIITKIESTSTTP